MSAAKNVSVERLVGQTVLDLVRKHQPASVKNSAFILDYHKYVGGSPLTVEKRAGMALAYRWKRGELLRKRVNVEGGWCYCYALPNAGGES